jgi:hypothetical protein
MKRRLDAFESSCPSCTADLVIVGVDFYHSSDGDESKSTFECSGCKERFHHIEKPYVAPKDKTPDFKCRFCGRQCTNMALTDDWTDYWKCLSCKTSYEHRYDPGFPDVQTINMYTTINGHLYVMRQFLDRIRTRIEMLPEDVEDTIVIAHEFPFLLPAVNPTNIQDKLLTYLIFS